MSPALLVASALWASGPASSPPPDDRAARSVVEVFTTFREPNYYQPWQPRNEEQASGSGCVLEGQRILTNAHVVSDPLYIQVRRAGDSRKYTAKVEYAAHDGELALLKVDDPSFFGPTTALKLGELPRRRDKVVAYGFPEGGEELSATEGIVSRIEVTRYAHSGRSFLAIQTDAALNPGNSGGPVLKDGKLVGVSFEIDPELQSTGYMVPVTMVRRFLKDIEDGKYDGIPELGVFTDPLGGESARAFEGLGPKDSGVRIAKVVFGSSAWGVLQDGDILLSIDGQRIGGDESTPLRGSDRVHFSNAIAMHQIGDKLAVGVLRDRRPLELEVVLKAPNLLVPGPLFDAAPRYFIYDGLVFVPLTENYIDQFDENEVSSALRFYEDLGLPSKERREIVLLSHVIPDDINAGYHGAAWVVVSKVNGRAIGELKDLVEAFEHPLDGHHVIEADPLTGFGARLVLDASKSAEASREILRRYGIPSDRSDDLKGL